MFYIISPFHISITKYGGVLFLYENLLSFYCFFLVTLPLPRNHLGQSPSAEAIHHGQSPTIWDSGLYLGLSPMIADIHRGQSPALKNIASNNLPVCSLLQLYGLGLLLGQQLDSAEGVLDPEGEIFVVLKSPVDYAGTIRVRRVQQLPGKCLAVDIKTSPKGSFERIFGTRGCEHVREGARSTT